MTTDTASRSVTATPCCIMAEMRKDLTTSARRAGGDLGSPTRRCAARTRNAKAQTQSSRKGGPHLLLHLDPSTQLLAAQLGPPAIDSTSMTMCRAANGKAQARKAASVNGGEAEPRLATRCVGNARRVSPSAQDGTLSTKSGPSDAAAAREGYASTAVGGACEEDDEEKIDDATRGDGASAVVTIATEAVKRHMSGIPDRVIA